MSIKKATSKIKVINVGAGKVGSILTAVLLCISVSAQAAVTRSCNYSYSGNVYSFCRDAAYETKCAGFPVTKSVSGSGSQSAKAAGPNLARQKAKELIIKNFDSGFEVARAKAVKTKVAVAQNWAEFRITLKITGDTNCPYTKTYSGAINL